MQRAIIIDDEQAGIETIKLLAARIPKLVKIVAATTDPAQGLLLVEDYRPDILFLDVSMPGMNGFELLNRLSWRQFRLVFTTAHREYAINAIKQQAFDYLL
ncbi:MAG: response regulator, partial [Dinghuibacter sp.]|nr:response regulator [Dinghuibacter sp.]